MVEWEIRSEIGHKHCLDGGEVVFYHFIFTNKIRVENCDKTADIETELFRGHAIPRLT